MKILLHGIIMLLLIVVIGGIGLLLLNLLFVIGLYLLDYNVILGSVYLLSLFVVFAVMCGLAKTREQFPPMRNLFKTLLALPQNLWVDL